MAPSQRKKPGTNYASVQFADHYTQARLFFRSQTPIEQDHIVAALIFELSKVETSAVRERVVSHLLNIDVPLATKVAAGLGLGKGQAFKAMVPPHDMPPSPALSIVAKAKATLEGRCLGLLVTDGANPGLVRAVQKAIEAAGAKTKVVAERIAGAVLSDGKLLAAHQRIEGGPSSLFDHVAVIASDDGAKRLAGMGAAQDFVRDAFAHLKTIGFTSNTKQLFEKAGLDMGGLGDARLVLAKASDADGFIDSASKGKFWDREPLVRPLPDPKSVPAK